MRAHLIANPAAGRGKGGVVAARVARLLDARGWETEVTVTREAGHAGEVARQSRAHDMDLVVAVGGDGLINEIINAPLEPGIGLGVIPAGTGNVLARELGLPFRWRAAAERLLGSAPVEVDVGEANGRKFVLMTGVGWDARLLEQVRRTPRRYLGKAQYVPAIAKMVWRPQRYRFSVTTEDGQYEAEGALLVASNTSVYTWLFSLTPPASLADGVLDFVLLRGRGYFSLTKAFMWSVFRKGLREEEAVYFRAARARVSASPAAPYQVDGDRAGEGPVEIALHPRALRLFVPPGHPLRRSSEGVEEGGPR